MRPGQWELRVGVVECSRAPGIFRMTLQTILREIPLAVIGIGSLHVGVFMASEAISRQIVYLIVDMAGDTLNCSVRSP